MWGQGWWEEVTGLFCHHGVIVATPAQPHTLLRPWTADADGDLDCVTQAGLTDTAAFSCPGDWLAAYTRQVARGDGLLGCPGSSLHALLTGLHFLSAQGSREPGEMLPRKLKRVLRQEFWVAFETLLMQGTEVGPVPYSGAPVLRACSLGREPSMSPCEESLYAK